MLGTKTDTVNGRIVQIQSKCYDIPLLKSLEQLLQSPNIREYVR